MRSSNLGFFVLCALGAVTWSADAGTAAATAGPGDRTAASNQMMHDSGSDTTAHDGPVDSFGCHTDSRGRYHCH